MLVALTKKSRLLLKDYEEEKHPRDEHGRWTSGGGDGGSNAEAIAAIDIGKVEAKTAANVTAASALAKANGVTPLPGSKGEHPNIIASRNPTAKKGAKAAAYGQPDVASMKLDPKRYAHDIGLFGNADFYPNFRAKDLAGSTDEATRAIVTQMKDNLKFLYQYADKQTQVWYDGARALVDDRVKLWGFNDASVAGVYAALSPTKDWDQNVHIADMLMKTYKTQQDHRWDDKMDAKSKTLWSAKNQKVVDLVRGKTLGELTSPAEKALWIRTYDETHNDPSYRVVLPNGALDGLKRNKDGSPSKVVWQSLPSITNAVKVLEAKGDPQVISEAMGAAHKVRSFFNNILDPHSTNGDVTIDTHAVGAALLRQLGSASVAVLQNFGNTPEKADKPEGWEAAGASKKTGLSGLYPVYAQAYREAAQELGIQPRQLQSAVWVVKRDTFGDLTKAQQGAVETTWRNYYNNPETTLSQTRLEIAHILGLEKKNERHYRVDEEGRRRSGDAGKLHRNGMGIAASAVDGGIGGGATGRASGLDVVRDSQRRVGTQGEKINLARNGQPWGYRDFDEGKHPRDEHGRWTSGGGGGGVTSGPPSESSFISPNIANLDFQHAVAQLDSPRQKLLAKVSDDIDRSLGISSTNQRVVGAWADGAENSMMVTAQGATSAQMRAASAMKGWLADQKAVLVFHPHEDAKEVMATFDVTGDVHKVHDVLLQDGVTFHTLEPLGENKIRVHVYASDNKTIAAVETAAQHFNDARVEFTPGTGEFIGTKLETGSDREQRDDARRAYEETIRGIADSGALDQDLAAVWNGVRDRWRADLEASGSGAASGAAEGKPAGEAQSERPATRAGYAPSLSGAYARESNRDAGSVRRPVEAVWALDPDGRKTAAAGGVTPLDFHELTAAGAEHFHDAITAAKQGAYGAAVHAYSVDEYQDKRTFVTPDDKAGFALNGNNIVSVFKHDESGARKFANGALALATQHGGRRLDGFDTVLPSLYAGNGFRVVGRLKWNDEYKPDGWDYERFKEFNGGRPDVVFMVYDPLHAQAYKAGEGKYVKDYDEGEAEQARALAEIDARKKAYTRQAGINDGFLAAIWSPTTEGRHQALLGGYAWKTFYELTLKGSERFRDAARQAGCYAVIDFTDARCFLTLGGGAGFMLKAGQCVLAFQHPAVPRIRGFDATVRALAMSIALREWDESKHPRDPAGKFSESGGGGAAGEAESATTVKPVSAPATEMSGGGAKKKAEVADFTKADIALDSATRVDTEKRQKFLQSWNDKIGEAPEEFKKEFLGGLPATMHIDYQDHADSLVLRGTLLNASGTSIGDYTRTIDLKKNKASSDYFTIKDVKQGGGIGKKLLAANVEVYRKLGLDKVEVHANIDVGGYAWARYGYVPTQASWNSLRRDLLNKLERGGGLRGGYTAESWDEISDHDQDVIKDAWMRSTRDEFIQSEIENWRESGQPLDDAKNRLAELYDAESQPEWALAGLEAWHDKLPDDAKIPFTDQQILAAVSVSYSSRYDDGRGDPVIEFDDSKLNEPAGYDPRQQTLPGIEPIKPHEALTEDMRSGIEKALVRAFNDKAESDAGDIDPPDFSDIVEDYQSEYWDSMRDRDKFVWARDNGSLPEIEPESDDGEEIDDAEAARNAVEHLLNSLDPKAIWAVADSSFGKQLLLNSDWIGAIDFHDKETMARFEAYVGGKK